MTERRTVTIQITAADQATTLPLADWDPEDIAEDIHIWGDITGPNRPLHNRVPNPAKGVTPRR